MTYYIIVTNHPDSKDACGVMNTTEVYEIAVTMRNALNKTYERTGSPARAHIIKDLFED